MIQIKNLHKSFSSLKVLNDINVEILKENNVAILGPNGSGKTTLMKSILGLVIPDSGTILINGNSVFQNYKIKKQISYLPQSIQFPENITVQELIKMMEDIRSEKANYEYWITQFDIQNTLSKKIKNLSGGTKQKVNIMIALMFENTEYIILDEPSVGLDPISRIKLKDWLKQKRNQNKTILLCTHILSDIEDVCDYLLFLLDGKVYYYGTINELLNKHNESKLENAIAKILTLKNHKL
ncbi:MAG: ABC transporter ATP-binding protein [Bacteroidia bacterium]|nr:MAG: ABC transporter ATP-binding protein [Bacteroidia bacterium]